MQNHLLRDDGRRGAISGNVRLRRHHCARVRGRRTSRNVPEHGPGHPGRIVCAAPAGGRRGQGAGDRDRRHRRRTYHGGGADAWCRGSPDRNGVSVLPGGENTAAAPGGAASRSRRQHRRHQRVQRPAGARPGQPGHPRTRACQRHRAGVSARQRCAGALACKGSGAGLGRFFSHVRRTGRRPWSRNAGRPTDPDIGCRST